MFPSVRGALQTLGGRAASLLVAGAVLSLAAPGLAREHVQRLRPNDPDARGYNVYLGFGGPPGNDAMDVGLLVPDGSGVAEVVLTGLPDDVEVQIEMTAYRDGLESARSNRIVLPPLAVPADPAPADPVQATSDTGGEDPRRATSITSGAENSDAPSLSGKSLKKTRKALRRAERKVRKLARKVKRFDAKLQGLQERKGETRASGRSARLGRKISRTESKISALMAALTEAQLRISALSQRLGSG